MNSFFYPKLALSNIKKNGKIYIPYILSSLFTVCMYYIIHSLAINGGFSDADFGSTTLPIILDLGRYVIIIFSVIFLFYINSFIIKRRKKEIALYNILGMEKKHVMIMMFFETLFTTLIALLGGLILGVVFSKLVFLVLINLAHIKTTIYYIVPMKAVVTTICIYIPIFFLSYVFNVVQIQISNPIELLRGSETGEKEPKAKWIFAVFGIVCLGIAYYLALTVKDLNTAFVLFFVAVILVILGTYALFTAGSIVILKMLKKNKKFYYQTKHFTSVSQMMYRMKQNAAGLASICILCTCILVMFSSTISLVMSVKDTIDIAAPYDVTVSVSDVYEDIQDGEEGEVRKLSSSEVQKRIDSCLTELSNEGIKINKYVSIPNYSFPLEVKDNKMLVGPNIGLDYSNIQTTQMIVMTEEDYNKAFDKDLNLKDQEIAATSNGIKVDKTMTINDESFDVVPITDNQYYPIHPTDELYSEVAVVVKDQQFIDDKLFKEDYSTNKYDVILMELDNSDEGPRIEKIFDNEFDNGVFAVAKSSVSSIYYELTGTLFFLGIFLGALFLMAAILIMYYKQLSEGYEDKKRFEIMQNVGMSQTEVKQAIKSQVLIFFFLPLVVAIIHMAFAFRFIRMMFTFVVLSRTSIFVISTLIAIVVLVIIYTIVYRQTAKTYYRIVRK